MRILATPEAISRPAKPSLSSLRRGIPHIGILEASDSRPQTLLPNFNNLSARSDYQLLDRHWEAVGKLQKILDITV